MSSLALSRRVILILGFFIVFIGFFFSGVDALKGARTELLSWISVISSVAFAIAIIRLLNRAVNSIRREKGIELFYWLLTLFGVAVIVVPGLLPPLGGHETFGWMYTHTYLIMNMTYSALAAFTLLTAAYRSYKLRNLETTALVVAGIIMLFGNAPIGEVIWKGFNPLGNWMLSVPLTGAFRGVMMTATIGLFGLVVRTLMGSEKVGA